jgi:hypothetical protein
MVAGFAEVIEREETLVAACNASEFVSPTIQIGTDSDRSMSSAMVIGRRLPPSKVPSEGRIGEQQFDLFGSTGI